MTPRTVALQASLSMEFPRQEYWNGLPFPSPGDLPYPGIKPASLMSLALVGRLFTAEPPESFLSGLLLKPRGPKKRDPNLANQNTETTVATRTDQGRPYYLSWADENSFCFLRG